MYPAGNGDSFVIKKEGAKQTTILIDGGYASTFQRYIHPDLANLASRGHSLNLVVSTHIDADHISGLLAFFRANGNSRTPKIIPVEAVWHNSLRSLISEKEVSVIKNQDDNDLLVEVCRRGFPPPSNPATEPAEISARQGSSLAALLLGGEYCWNSSNGDQSINACDASLYELNGEVQLRVISPTRTRLEQLREHWIGDLRRIGFTGKIGSSGAFDDAFEFLSAFDGANVGKNAKAVAISSTTNRCLDEIYLADDSVTNGSSIALIIEVGSSRILFLGDAWSEDIEAGLRLLPNANFPMVFDAVKISHHGSFRNTSPALLKLIDSPVFLISSSGERHNHPDVEVLKAIVDRPSDFQRHLHFNYSTPASQYMHHHTTTSGAEFAIHEGDSDWIEIGAKQQ